MAIPLRACVPVALALLASRGEAGPSRPDSLMPDPSRAAVHDGVTAQASVNGKYRTLLRKLWTPEDLPDYGKFNDYGYYEGNAWRTHKDLPPGYWVYVYPHWYIWKVGPQGPAPPRPGAAVPPGVGR